MLTGLYPRTHGLYCNGVALDESLPVLPGRLAEAGYHTHGIGKFHLQPAQAPAEHGFPESWAFWESDRGQAWTGPYYGFQQIDLVLGHGPDATRSAHYADWLRRSHPEAVDLYARARALSPPEEGIDCWKLSLPASLHYNTWIADRAVNFLRRAEPPFFLFVSFPDPHHPFAAPRPYCDRFDPDSIELPRVVEGELERMPPYYLQPPHPDEQGAMLATDRISQSALRMVIAQTYGLVEMIDDCVGRVMDQLQASGSAEETIVLFTSDHGELLGDHGLVRKGPPPYRQLLEVPFLMAGPGLPRGRSVSALTSHLDIAPTLLELAGLDPAKIRGEGCSLLGLFSGATDSVRDASLAEYHPRAREDLYNQTIRTERWRLTLYPHHADWGELFDLAQDPAEHHNRYGEPGLAGVVTELRAILQRDLPPKPRIESPRVAKY